MKYKICNLAITHGQETSTQHITNPQHSPTYRYFV